jgi:hypothetical protein
MDTKLTLSFNEEIIEKAKKFAAERNISLSRLTELLLTKAVTTSNTYSLDDFPVADWVNSVSEPLAEYKKKKTTNKARKKEFYGK